MDNSNISDPTAPSSNNNSNNNSSESSNSNNNNNASSSSNNNNNNNNESQSDNDSSTNNNDHLNQFVILQFGEGSQQDVIIDYRNNIRNAIVEQRQRRLSSSLNTPRSTSLNSLLLLLIMMASSSSSSNNTTTTPPSSLQQDRSPSNLTSGDGVRGVDFPAFDVSSEGVYGANRTSSRIFDLLNPGSGDNSRTLTNTTPDTTATTTNDTNSNNNSQPSSETPTTTPQTTPSNGSNRNIILTVNYEYSSGVDPEEARDRSASLVLNVPNVPQGEDDTRLQALIRFATIILFRTIAMSLQNKQRGISDKQFAKLPVKSLDELEDKNCPICYDEFEKPSKKRSRDEEDTNDEKISKNQKSNDGIPIFTSEKMGEIPTNSKEPVIVRYTHVPVEMPCKHVFGQDCLHEWLKQNNSCPLCRYKMYDENRNTDGIQTTTMNLPNLARFLSDNSRDSLLNGEINRLPMLVVSNDSDPSTALESLDNDLRNNLNNVPIIVTTAPAGGIPTSIGDGNIGRMNNMNPTTSPSNSSVASPTGWNRFTRENIVRRIINSLTSSAAGRNTTSSSSSSSSAGSTTTTPSLVSRTGFGTGSAIQSIRDLHRERVLRRVTNSNDNNSSLSTSEFVNGDTLFPIGVSSRRTPSGVHTMNVNNDSRIRGNGNGEMPPLHDDFLVQESIVNDLLFGTGGSATSRASATSTPAQEEVNSLNSGSSTNEPLQRSTSNTNAATTTSTNAPAPDQDSSNQ